MQRGRSRNDAHECVCMLGYASVILIFMGAALLQGCHVIVSEAYIEPNPNTDWYSENKARFSILHSHGIAIYVRASNTDPSSFGNKLYPNYFGVSLWFNTEGNDFRFNPNEVFLSFADVEKLKPVKIKLESAGLSAHDAGWECGNYPTKDFGPGPSYVLRRGFCVELYFNVNAPSPETSFSMRLDSLMRGDKQIVVPEIRFRKGSFWVIG